uniref:Cytochrome c oxidase subunit 2 n=2 Tax=Magnusiomyces TaxID=1095182 RepID=A0A8E5N8A8_9ASCO|nr:cytochrome c oxidase subunit 2 [Magnusiomyces ingens]YP_010180077.1 cytochrome c oxidase subunit 2 [Saprochaete ingens]AHY04912.1 cytochrome c oxidase subunit 2 [Magnusiomyces ingens]QUX32921.1 cytochrome c oxidase subunit 2 [Magnusiomyces ingens]QUX32945.1 cytochrome c oxidase subunit 2 [Saprochaete ingens]
MFNLYFNMMFNDVPKAWGMYFQDSATAMAEGMMELHDIIMFYMVIVLTLVTYMLYSMMTSFNNNKNPMSYKYMIHGTTLEVIWTMFPAVMLMFIALPSFVLLYLSDEVIDPAMTVKAIGYQWYWVYEYSDFINDSGETIQLESYIIPDDLLEEGQLHSLDVDNRLVAPIDTHIRIVVTANDVIHDFTVPSLGIKIDACPGRLNQLSAIIQREGVFYGQCSELCGAAHAYMPIVIEAVTLPKFLEWLNEQ